MDCHDQTTVCSVVALEGQLNIIVLCSIVCVSLTLYREDKQIEDASSSDQVAELYQAQVRKMEPATSKQPETILQQQDHGDIGRDVSTEEDQEDDVAQQTRI